ncbi:O-antigen ligase family protein [Ornithinicoccus hortensis]|uniref:O-antigen ligase family protein n=1 Tax=Ornithinicoccus hortensis TaxID=82346 RepID=UPI0011538EDF|nr:O-antigen ligase family protein [Ornithinicoccus hortensis]
MGIGDLIWVVAASIMMALLLRTSDVRLPRWFGLWIAFLAWVLASGSQLDSTGRVVAFGYRFALYVSATVIAVYAFNAVRSLTLRYISGVMTIFLLVMTVGGLIGVLHPLFSFETPLSWILPEGLKSNEMVREMVFRRATQWNPTSWEQTDPRPSAPFLYTNTWGNVYSVVFPFVCLYAWITRGGPRCVATVLLIAASVIPATLTLNRGMMVGLAVVGGYLLYQAFRAGRMGSVLLGCGAILVLAMSFWVSGAFERLDERLDTGSSTEDRTSLYVETVLRTASSPLLGYGGPRPAAEEWLPALGTQGQLWTLLFSHGFVGAALFLGWFTLCMVRGWRRLDLAGSVLTGIVAATLVETLFYGMMTGLNISLLAAVLLPRREVGPPSRASNQGGGGGAHPLVRLARGSAGVSVGPADQGGGNAGHRGVATTATSWYSQR